MNSTIAGLAARTILPDEWEDYLKVRERTFGASSTPSQSEYLRRLTDLDRAIAVFDQGQIVATCVAWALEVSTPGRRTTGCGGLTLGQVLPTHRRRGILSGMLSLLQEDAKRRGEAIVAGWPSEAGIHNRFGWGVTTMAAELQIAAADLRLLSGFDTRGRVQFVEPSDAISRLKPIYEEARLATPGVPNRSDARWDGWLSHDNGRLKGADWAKDTGPRTFAEWDGRGYVAYRLQRTCRSAQLRVSRRHITIRARPSRQGRWAHSWRDTPNELDVLLGATTVVPLVVLIRSVLAGIRRHRSSVDGGSRRESG